MTEPANKPAAPSAPPPEPSSHVPMAATPPASGSGAASVISSVLAALRFFTRFPLPVFAFEPHPHAPLNLSRHGIAVVAAGAMIGATGAVVLAGAASAGLPPLLAALLALAALALITGAMHEDGLADTADGFWGGRTVERRLEIMRDSRIGSYGVTAIVFVTALRAVALAALLESAGTFAAATAIIVIGATSRAAALVPLWLLPAARRDGAAAAVNVPRGGAMVVTVVTALLLSAGLLWSAGVPARMSALSIAAGFSAAWAITRVARSKIGGHTGDVAGAAQQLAEAAMLVVLAAR